MGLSNKLSCEAGSFSHCLNPHRIFQSEVLGLISLLWSPGLRGLSCFPVVPVYLHANAGLPHLPATVLPQVLHAWLPISAPPTHLDECFFFNSLGVGLPYSSIFWQFWLFFVFKFVVVLVLVVRGGTVCLPMPPSSLEVQNYYILKSHTWGFTVTFLFCVIPHEVHILIFHFIPYHINVIVLLLLT